MVEKTKGVGSKKLIITNKKKDASRSKILEKYPERKSEIAEISRIILDGRDAKIYGAEGTGKTQILRGLLEELSANYIYMSGRSFGTLSGFLHAMFDQLKDLALKSVPPNAHDKRKEIEEEFGVLNSVDDFDREEILKKVAKYLHKANNKGHIILVFDRVHVIADHKFCDQFESFDWRKRGNVGNQYVMIFVDEFSTKALSEGCMVEFKPYTDQQALSIFQRRLPEHEMKAMFLDRFMLDFYQMQKSVFSWAFSCCLRMFRDFCSSKGESTVIKMRDLMMPAGNTDLLIREFAPITCFFVCAAFCCRNNPPEYDERFFKRKCDRPLTNKPVIINERKVQENQFTPIGKNSNLAYERYAQKPFPFARLWAWAQGLWYEKLHQKPFPRDEDVLLMAVRPLQDAQILEIQSVNNQPFIQCRAGNKLAFSCAQKVQIELNQWIVSEDNIVGRKTGKRDEKDAKKTASVQLSLEAWLTKTPKEPQQPENKSAEVESITDSATVSRKNTPGSGSRPSLTPETALIHPDSSSSVGPTRKRPASGADSSAGAGRVDKKLRISDGRLRLA